MAKEGINHTKGDQYLINGIGQVDLKELQNKSHQLVNASAFEISVFLPRLFSPLKAILNMPCGFISSSSRECSFPGNNVSLSSLWLSYSQEAWGKGWFGNLLSQNGRICFPWRVVRIISKPRGQWDPETCGTLLNIPLGSSLGTILRAHFLWLIFLEIWSEKRNKINK